MGNIQILINHRYKCCLNNNDEVDTDDDDNNKHEDDDNRGNKYKCDIIKQMPVIEKEKSEDSIITIISENICK